MSTATTNSTFAGSGTRSGIADRLKNLLQMLDDGSRSLRKAIISHDAAKVWELLAEQERIVAEFEQYSALWVNFASTNRGNAEIENSIKEIRSSYDALREKNRGNITLIKSFLSAIDKAFKRNGTQLAIKTNVYGKHGKMNYRQSSLVIKREG